MKRKYVADRKSEASVVDVAAQVEEVAKEREEQLAAKEQAERLAAQAGAEPVAHKSSPPGSHGWGGSSDG